MYQEIKPSKRIDNLVDTFWTFSKNEVNEKFKVLPDTCSDLVFDFSQNRGFLSGVMTTYQFKELSPETDLIGVRFKSEKIGLLFDIPLYETKNLRVELSELFPTKTFQSLNQVNDLETTIDKIAFLENFIEMLFNQNHQKRDQIVLSTVQNIRTSHGIININDIAKSHNISLRQLERRFKNCVGLTAKEFSNVVRFNNARESISKLSKTSLLEIAFDMGFFDHSHMTHEFKRISGENPSFF
ncbi:helix-turn-helix domain-containing protein [Flavobacteriaceae bacterium R38]|nr:helix-turn-helix domain-containing protein [Flavobacteriaceae bacterium R38]